MLFYALFAGSKLTVLTIEGKLHQTGMLLAKDLTTDLTVVPSIEKAELFFALITVGWGFVRNPLWTFWLIHNLIAHILLFSHEQLLLIWAVIECHIYRFSIYWEVIVLEKRGSLIGIIMLVLNGKRVVLRTAELLLYRLIDKFRGIWWSSHHVLRHVYIVPKGRPTRSLIVSILCSLFIKVKCEITFRRGWEHLIKLRSGLLLEQYLLALFIEMIRWHLPHFSIM